MKLLNADQDELAVLDEGTTKIAYYGKDPALIYFTAEKTNGVTDSQTCTVKKIEALDGFIETDGGTKVAIEGSLAEKISILETVLGVKFGGFAGTLPQSTVDFYKKNDSNDAGVINVTVHVSDDEDDDESFEFTRGPNEVTVADVIASITAEAPDGKTLIGLAPAGTTDVLNATDKVLEDQEFDAIYADAISISVKRGLDDSDTEALTITVDATLTLNDALKEISEDETVTGWVDTYKDGYEFVSIVNADGSAISKKEGAASASKVTGGLKLSWNPLYTKVDTTEVSAPVEGETYYVMANYVYTAAAESDFTDGGWTTSKDYFTKVSA